LEGGLRPGVEDFFGGDEAENVVVSGAGNYDSRGYRHAAVSVFGEGNSQGLGAAKEHESEDSACHQHLFFHIKSILIVK